MVGNESEGLWTVQDVAAHLQLAEGTIRNRVMMRTIPFVKVGKGLRFRPSEIAQWIDDETARARGDKDAA